MPFEPDTLYVTDLDGTLLGDDGRISARSAAVLGDLLDGGVPVTIATARSYGTARRAIGDLPLRLPLAVYGGAFVVEPEGGQPTWKSMLDPVAAEALVQACEDHALPPFVFWLRDGDDRISWRTGSETPGVFTFLHDRPGDKRLLPVADWGAVDKSAVFFVSVLGDPVQLAALAATVKTSAWGATCTLALQPSKRDRRGSVLDLTAATATKASAAKRIAGGAGLRRIVAFGDGPNDLPLFQEADEAYAVGNASDDVKAIATDVIGANSDDGVAEWLAEHALQGADARG